MFTASKGSYCENKDFEKLIKHYDRYSFSTTENQYNWQASNSATFNTNGKIYIYVQDAVGNVALVSTQIINKIQE